MKLPRKINLCGKAYKTKRLPIKHKDDGFFDSDTHVIAVRKIGHDPDEFEALIHELMEGATFVLGCTFTRDTGEDCLYVMEHQDLENVAKGIAGALWPIIKKGLE